MKEAIQSIPWLAQAAFSDLSSGLMISALAIASALVVGKFLHFWPYLWNKSWNGGSVLLLALIGGGATGVTGILVCGTFKSEAYIQSWFKGAEKELSADPVWRWNGFSKAARDLSKSSQPPIDQGLSRLDIKNATDWNLLVSAQHQAAKGKLQLAPLMASLVPQPSKLQIPMPSLTAPASYPVTVGPDNPWTASILKSVIPAFKNEAIVAGDSLATKARLISSIATFSLCALIMITLAIAADHDILDH